ncbi:MAG: DUF4065 domain-containing protein [Dehalococcoidia bacterium]|nr:DUF4065 domain-containing protein [Dehalococcoidia bacterium]
MRADLRDVILYLVYNAKYSPTKTSLMKLVYLADYYYWQLHGEQMTDCKYELGNYGVFCSDIPNTAESMDKRELKLTMFLFGSGYQLNYLQGPEPAAQFELTDDCLQALNKVIAKHSGQSLPALKRSHHQTEPLQAVKVKGGKLDMSKIQVKPRIKEHPHMKELQKHILGMDLIIKGSPEERAEQRQQIMTALSIARKRANTARLRVNE